MRTRFAPSPTGPLHLGHAFSALTAWDMAAAAGGAFLLRIEDIDEGRVRPEWEAAIKGDLAWLGLVWPEPAWRQSERRGRYDAALGRLAAMGLLYPCGCSRADIRAAVAAPQEGAAAGAYPGTCRGRSMAAAGSGCALRLDMAAALAAATAREFTETGPAHSGRHARDDEALLRGQGDVVLARRDGAVAYHLAVVVDDAEQAISHVVRGEDLWEATQVHVLLQALLGVPTPVHHHHRLIRDAAGRRLAKRDDSRAIAAFRAEGATPAAIRAMVGL